MVEYNCDRCKKVFNKKSSWIDHIDNRKKPCQIKKELSNHMGMLLVA